MQPAIASMRFSYHSGLMDLTTVSPKYQVVIPKRVREQFGLAPGQQLQVIALPGRIELFKWVLREHSEAEAIQAVAVMQRGLVVDLGSRLAIASAQLSHALHVPIRPGSTRWMQISRISTTWN